MNFLKTPFKLGSIHLPSNIFYAPLAGCSDFPFRQMAAHHQPGLMYCEMVKMEALLRDVPGTYRMLEYSQEMRPIGAQIVGSNPKLAGKSAKICEDLGFDVIDLNCGCPVDKVTKDGSGSGTLKNPEIIGEILSEMVAAVKVPVTVKIRAGWDDDSIVAPLITQIAEKAGAAAITVHGRTRQQAYHGPANWDHIKAAKQAAKSILVIGNGDLFTPEAVPAMFAYTGCDGVLVSRGTFGQPWIVQEAIQLLEGKTYKPRTPEEMRAALLQHLNYSYLYKEEIGALIDLRRISPWYLKNVPGVRELRASLAQIKSVEEAKARIINFSLNPESNAS